MHGLGGQIWWVSVAFTTNIKKTETRERSCIPAVTHCNAEKPGNRGVFLVFIIPRLKSINIVIQMVTYVGSL